MEEQLGGGLGALETRKAARMAGGMGAQNLLGTAAGQMGGLGGTKSSYGCSYSTSFTKAKAIKARWSFSWC